MDLRTTKTKTKTPGRCPHFVGHLPVGFVVNLLRVEQESLVLRHSRFYGLHCAVAARQRGTSSLLQVSSGPRHTWKHV